MKPLAFLYLCLFLISCANDPNTGGQSNAAKLDSTASVKPGGGADGIQTLTVGKALFDQYTTAYQNDTLSSDKVFFSKLLTIMKKFDGRRLDTTLLTIGDIDDDNSNDTIVTRVYYLSDTVRVDSRWMKGNALMWQSELVDPYYEFGSDLLGYEKRRPWVVFAVAVVYGAPEFKLRSILSSEPDSNGNNMIYGQGVDDLAEMGVRISKNDYRAYLQSFKGDLLLCGDPWSRERLWIWYKPAGKMITYFQP